MTIDITLLGAAKRASDIINEIVTNNPRDDIKQKWLAFKLSNGDSNKVLYDTRRSAVRHTINRADRHFYVCLRGLPQGAKPHELAVWIAWERDVANNSRVAIPDPDSKWGGQQAAPTTLRMDYMRNQIAEQLQVAHIAQLAMTDPKLFAEIRRLARQ